MNAISVIFVFISFFGCYFPSFLLIVLKFSKRWHNVNVNWQIIVYSLNTLSERKCFLEFLVLVQGKWLNYISIWLRGVTCLFLSCGRRHYLSISVLFFIMIRVFLYQNLYLEVYLCIFTDIHERQRNNYFFLKMIVCSISISSKILCICKGCEGDNIGLWGQKKSLTILYVKHRYAYNT